MWAINKMGTHFQINNGLRRNQCHLHFALEIRVLDGSYFFVFIKGHGTCFVLVGMKRSCTGIGRFLKSSKMSSTTDGSFPRTLSGSESSFREPRRRTMLGTIGSVNPEHWTMCRASKSGHISGRRIQSLQRLPCNLKHNY